jgi:ABC-2 type transport system permease protein
VRADELTVKAGKLFGLPVAPGATLEKDWPDEIHSEAVRGNTNAKIPSSVQQNVPAWLIFAMFFVVIPVSSIFIIERQQGTLQRLRAMGVPFHLVLAGKLLPFFIVNQVQAALMVLVGMYLVPQFGSEALELPSSLPLLLNWWAVSSAVSLAAVSWALLIASIAKTSEQATIVGGVGNILMGAVGGIMVPKFIMPASMQKIAALSPMAWGLEGFHTIMLRHGSFADILPSLAQLLVFAAASLLAAIWLNQRALAAQS